MGRTTKFPKMWSEALVALLMLMVPLLLITCGGQPTEVAVAPTDAPAEVAPTDAPPTEALTDVPPTEPPPTQAPTEPPPTEAPTEPPATDTPEPTDEPTPEPTDAPIPEAVDDTACIGCHTDEETLKLVAEEEEKPEVESEGEG